MQSIQTKLKQDGNPTNVATCALEVTVLRKHVCVGKAQALIKAEEMIFVNVYVLIKIVKKRFVNVKVFMIHHVLSINY